LKVFNVKYLRMKIVVVFLLLASIIQPCLSQQNTIIGKSELSYILPPSQLLDGITPEANWIWDSGEIKPKNYYLHVRKSFFLNNLAEEARAFISASSFAELYINGQYIDRVPTNPDPEFQTYEEINLTPYLKKGTNTIAALVYNAGEGLHHRIDARSGFFFQAKISDNKGEVTKVNSNKSWRVTQAVAWDSNTNYRQRDHTICQFPTSYLTPHRSRKKFLFVAPEKNGTQH